MNKISLICFLALVVFLSSTSIFAQENKQDEQIKEMLNKFYTRYITIVSDVQEHFEEKLDTLKMKYCTHKLVKKIQKQLHNQEIDWDPFLKAQDANSKCLNSLSIQKDTKKNNVYSVSWIEPYDNSRTTIKLHVIFGNGCYKIDSVW